MRVCIDLVNDFKKKKKSLMTTCIEKPTKKNPPYLKE